MRAVDVANQSLKIARLESTRSALMIAESVKSRLDINAPVVSLSLNVPTVSEYAWSRSRSPEAAEWDEDAGVPSNLHAPQENQKNFWVRVPVVLSNEGSASVTLEFWPPVSAMQGGSWGSPQRRHDIAAGNQALYAMAIGGTLQEWIASAANDNDFCLWAQWSVVLKGNSGVVLHQRVEIRGPSAREAPSGVWSLARLSPTQNRDGAEIIASPILRTYVLDQSKGIEIPDTPTAILESHP
ncbi:hypothetical protein GCM10027403_14560 [Arthrobacter tecti]